MMTDFRFPRSVVLVDDSEPLRNDLMISLCESSLCTAFNQVRVMHNNQTPVWLHYWGESILSNASQCGPAGIVFLDWRLTDQPNWRENSGVDLALLALDPKLQPLRPHIYCISGDSIDMKKEILRVYRGKDDVENRVTAMGKDINKIKQKIIDYLATPIPPAPNF